MEISIIGLGYVGLITGICLAEVGHSVIGVDLNKDIVSSITAGHAHFYEDGLNALLNKHLATGNFKVTTDTHIAVQKTAATIIAVNTPFTQQTPNLTYLKTATTEVATALRSKSSTHTVIIKSTVVPKTCLTVVQPILTSQSKRVIGESLGFGMNPEFLREGSAVNDFMNPDRIIIGTNDKIAKATMTDIYKPFGRNKILTTSITNAEMMKYTSNAFFALQISFSNEISALCSLTEDADVATVMNSLHLDKRLSSQDPNQPIGLINYLRAGCGFGGSCFPKDLKSIIHFAKENNSRAPLLEAALDINEQQINKVIHIIKSQLADLKDRSIGILGLAFKPGTDDIRESPAVNLAHRLINAQSKVYCYDPLVKAAPNGTILLKNISDVILSVEIIIICTNWEEFKNLPHLLIKMKKQSLPVLDSRQLLTKNKHLNILSIDHTVKSACYDQAVKA